MDITIILIAISLAIDCFVISVCINSINKLKKLEYIRLPMHFGLFQLFMTVIGYYLGSSFRIYIDSFDHWIAFLLLVLIGIKMIIDSLKKECKVINKLDEKTLIGLSVATSIDALAIGIAFSMIDGGIIINSIIIGLFAFGLSLIGLLIGRKIRKFNIGFIGIIGGLVLIGIGIRVLLTHMHIF
jgi:manganese efflux pump family protein